MATEDALAIAVTVAGGGMGLCAFWFGLISTAAGVASGSTVGWPNCIRSALKRPERPPSSIALRSGGPVGSIRRIMCCSECSNDVIVMPGLRCRVGPGAKMGASVHRSQAVTVNVGRLSSQANAFRAM
jgi:hypothetical protein